MKELIQGAFGLFPGEEVQQKNGNHLAAVRKGREPSKPYRVRGQEAAISAEIRECTSELGQLVERQVLRVWSGQLERPDIVPKQEMEEVLAEIAPLIEDRGRDGMRARSVYQELAEPVDLIPFDEDTLLLPAFAPLNFLFEKVDGFYGTNLLGFYQDLLSVSEGGSIPSRARYLVDTLLILAREMISPCYSLKEDCWVIEGEDVFYRGQNIAQFDGFMIMGSRFHILKERIDFGRILRGGRKYSILEIKTVFRTADSLNRGRFNRGVPKRHHLVRTTGQLAKMALNFSGRDGGTFRFPENLIFVYLRGPLSPAVCSVDLGVPFFKQWREALLEERQSIVYAPVQQHEIDRMLEMLNLALSKKETE